MFLWVLCMWIEGSLVGSFLPEDQVLETQGVVRDGNATNAL